MPSNQPRIANTGASVSSNTTSNPVANPTTNAKTGTDQAATNQAQDSQKNSLNGSKLIGKRPNPEGGFTSSAISSLIGGASYKRQQLEEDNPLEKLVSTKPEDKKDQ